MNRIELWTGIPDRVREKRAIELSLTMSEQGKSVWWLTETQRQSEQVETTLLAASKGCVVGIETILLQNVAKKILAETYLNFEIVPREVRELLLGELLNDKSVVERAGAELPLSWAAKISTLYNRLLDEKVNNWVALQRGLINNYKWISEVIEKYDKRVADRGLLDEAYLPITALEALDKKEFNRPDLIVIDRYGSIPLTQLKLLQKLVRYSDLSIALIDDFGNSEYSRDLESWLSLPGIEVKSFSSSDNIRNVVSNFLKKEKNELISSTPVSLIIEKNINSEVRTVANEISRLIHDEELSSDQIAVVVGDSTEYSRRIEEIFPQYGVLPDIQTGSHLSKTNVTALAIRLFRLRASGLKRESVIDILANQFVNGPGVLSNNRSVFKFDSYARKVGIKDSFGSFEKIWLEPLKREINYLESREEEIESPQNKQESRWLNEAIRDFETFGRKVLSLPDPCRTEEAISWLEEIFEFLNVRKNIQYNARSNPEKGQNELLAFSRLNITLSHLAQALQIQRKSRWSVERLLKTLERSVSKARISVNRRLSGGVTVYGAEEIRGLEKEKVFLLGFTDKNWPPSPEIDVINPQGVEWLNGDKLTEYRLLLIELYLNSSTLYLSIPCPVEGESKELPSPMLKEIFDSGIMVHELETDRLNFRSYLDLLPQIGKELENENSQEAGIGRLLAAKKRKRAFDPIRTLQGVSVELGRNNPKTLTPYEGMINNSIVLEKISNKLTQKPLSPTSLDQYAKCPMRYFFNTVLNLKELKDVEETAEAWQKGNVIHEILANVAKKLRESDMGFADDPEKTKELLLSEAEKSAKKLPNWNLFSEAENAKLTAGLKESSSTVGPLKLLLDYEINKLNEKVLFVEASFGLPADEDSEILLEDPIVISENETLVKLCGKIDRISRTDKGKWRIWDYKISGSQQASVGKMKDGLSFQLPIYMFAFEKYLEEHGEESSTIEFAAYYQIQEGKQSIKLGSKLKHEEYEKKVLTDFRSRVVAIYNSIQSGNFHTPLSENSGLCSDRSYCSFDTICRRDFDHFSLREKYLEEKQLINLYLSPIHSRYLDIQAYKENCGGVE